MKSMIPTWLLSLALIQSACAGPAVSTRAARPAPDSSPEDSGLGLFSGDASVLSDPEIARILDYQWRIPEHVRIAVFALQSAPESRGYRSYGAEGNSSVQTATSAIETLRSIPGVFDVSYLPEFLLPPQKTVPLLREAAARYQADWILIYRSDFRTEAHNRAFGTDEATGICVVDCAVLDTRTGIIPFSSRATEMFARPKDKGMSSMYDLVMRAEQQAFDSAMRRNAEALAEFVATVERGP
ncbi:MAG: hypothetical protein KC591_06805 [Gemmatimonadetes bacterium]|nr:hypothetical protein [Gemmatimonadota bacterium]